MSRAADHRFNERIETQRALRTQRTRYDAAGQFLCVLSDLCVFFVESISGCMTYAFAARPEGTFFCLPFSCGCRVLCSGSCDERIGQKNGGQKNEFSRATDEPRRNLPLASTRSRR